MSQVTADTGATTEGDTSDDEEYPPPRWSEHIKSSLHRTWFSMVLNKVILWPHKVVYTSGGKPNAYQNISKPLFVKGYLIVMDTEERLIRQKMSSHLKDLMSDAQPYRWDWVRTFHGVWLNQLQQGHCTWMNGVEKLKFCRALVWHPASSFPSAPPLPGPQGGPVNAATSPPHSTMPRPGQAPKPARPTTPWNVKKAGNTQSTSISAPSAFSPSTVHSHTLRRIALGRDTAPSCPHAGYTLTLMDIDLDLPWTRA